MRNGLDGGFSLRARQAKSFPYSGIGKTTSTLCFTWVFFYFYEPCAGLFRVLPGQQRMACASTNEPQRATAQGVTTLNIGWKLVSMPSIALKRSASSSRPLPESAYQSFSVSS
jgi:hypothetical protein